MWGGHGPFRGLEAPLALNASVERLVDLGKLPLRSPARQRRWAEFDQGFEPRFPASALRARLTRERQSFDTAGSALTGRHQPAAREYSHLFGVRLSNPSVNRQRRSRATSPLATPVRSPLRAQLSGVLLPLTQRTAQLVIAREYGCPGWQDLTAEVSKRLGRGAELAAAQARRTIHDYDVERLTQLLAELSDAAVLARP